MKVVVFGTFDNLHPGHLFFLSEATKRGDLHVVVARDKNVERIKNKTPVLNENERVEAICQAFPDADVRLGDAEDFLAPLRQIQPDLIMFGYDQKLPPGATEGDLNCKTERLGQLG